MRAMAARAGSRRSVYHIEQREKPALLVLLQKNLPEASSLGNQEAAEDRTRVPLPLPR